MRRYQKRIKEYRKLIQERYVREAAVQKVISRWETTAAGKDDRRISYFEFLYEQSRFIEKKWWGLQGAVLLLLWYLLKDNGMNVLMERMTGELAAVFAILIIPEIWKNRRYSSVAVEKASYYSLRQICAARILLFAAVDMAMVTVFFAAALQTQTGGIMAYWLAVNFLLPLLMSCCICFRLLCSRRQGMEYTAAALCIICSLVWLTVMVNNAFYERIAVPVWIGLILLFLGYLIFCIQKSLFCSEMVWDP